MDDRAGRRRRILAAVGGSAVDVDDRHAGIDRGEAADQPLALVPADRDDADRGIADALRIRRGH